MPLNKEIKLNEKVDFEEQSFTECISLTSQLFVFSLPTKKMLSIEFRQFLFVLSKEHDRSISLKRLFKNRVDIVCQGSITWV